MIHERADYNERVQCVDGSIPEDEPVFLLRGKDSIAHKVIEYWCFLNRHGVPKDVVEAKLASVMAHADRMRDYERELSASYECTC